MAKISLQKSPNTALLVVDVQNDFLPGGALAVENGDRILPAVNRLIQAFTQRHRLVVATRDWHPENHCSFLNQHGPWPPHCVQGSEGAKLSEGLKWNTQPLIVSKGQQAEAEEYSGFAGRTSDNQRLDEVLSRQGVDHLIVTGLATDYCVLNTVKDALQLGYRVTLVKDAVAGVNVQPEDEVLALREMTHSGAHLISSQDIGD